MTQRLKAGTAWNHPAWGGWWVNHGKQRQQHPGDFCSKGKNKDWLFKEGIRFSRFWTLLSIKGRVIYHCKQPLSPKPLNPVVKQGLKQEITDWPRFSSQYSWKEKWRESFEAFLHPVISGSGWVSSESSKELGTAHVHRRPPPVSQQSGQIPQQQVKWNMFLRQT